MISGELENVSMHYKN